MKIKLFHDKKLERIECDVNDFLKSIGEDQVVDIKQDVHYHLGTINWNTMFTVMIMYGDKKPQTDDMPKTETMPQDRFTR